MERHMRRQCVKRHSERKEVTCGIASNHDALQHKGEIADDEKRESKFTALAFITNEAFECPGACAAKPAIPHNSGGLGGQASNHCKMASKRQHTSKLDISLQ